MCFRGKAKGLWKMLSVNLILPVFMKVKRACVFSFYQGLWEIIFRTSSFWRLVQLLVTCLIKYCLLTGSTQSVLEWFESWLQLEENHTLIWCLELWENFRGRVSFIFSFTGFIAWHSHSVRWMHTHLHMRVYESMLLSTPHLSSQSPRVLWSYAFWYLWFYAVIDSYHVFITG